MNLRNHKLKIFIKLLKSIKALNLIIFLEQFTKKRIKKVDKRINKINIILLIKYII